MKKFMSLFLTAVSTAFIYAQSGIINNGARITISEGAKLDITGGFAANYVNSYFGNSNGRIELNGIFNLEGSWFNNSNNQIVFSVFGQNAMLVFDGMGQQIIGGTSPTVFPEIFVDGQIHLAQHLLIGNQVILNGVITLNDYDFHIPDFQMLNSTSGYSTSAMIVTNGSGKLIVGISGNGIYTVPVGDQNGVNHYSPVTLDFLNGTFNNAKVYIGVKNQKHPNNNSTTNYLNCYWELNKEGIDFFNCAITLEFDASDVVGNSQYISGAQWNNASWILGNPVTSNCIVDTVDFFSTFTGIDNQSVGIITLENEKPEIIVLAANGVLFIISETDLTGCKISVFDCVGKLIKTQIADNIPTNEIRLHAPSGIYILNFSGKTFEKNMKILIK